MEREDAILRLAALEGKDLRELADEQQVTVWKNGKLNKGWAGHTVERFLGLPINSAQSPNLGTWELKVVPLKWKDDQLVIKETIAITMIDPVEVNRNDFEESHLYNKLRKIIAVSRIWEDHQERRSICHGVNAFELEGTELYGKVVEDYEQVRSVIRDRGFDTLSGRIGKFVQPRTKGTGHGSKTRAFYARKELVEYIIGLKHSRQIRERPMSRDCRKHAGKSNLRNRTPMDVVMVTLPANQSGKGRHRCAYCAYEAGYNDALAELGR